MEETTVAEPYVKLTPEQRREIEETIKALDMQQYAIKIIINSLYGAFGNKHFYFYDPDIAQSITMQGQDLIKFSIRALNFYMMEKWHLDKELHEKLGILGHTVNKIDKECVIYADTDSSYVSFLPIVLSIEGKTFNTEEAIHFVKEIIDLRLAKFLDNAFEKYAEAFDTINQMEFKLENISSVGIWVAKKSYVVKVAFEDGFYLPTAKTKATGIALAKPSFPSYGRDKQRELVDVLLAKGYSVVHEKDIIPRLRDMRKAFQHMDVEDVCFNKNITAYDKYVIDDSSLEMPKGMPFGSRATLYHNNIITRLNNLKYQKIREGNKVKLYYAKHPENPEMDVFAFMPGNYPEFAFPLDRDVQFFHLVTDPINALLESMGLQLITPMLKRDVKFNMPKTKKEMKPEDIYPLYIIHNETLEYIEFPRYLEKYFVRPDLEIPENIFEEYVSYISTYKLYTEVVPKFDLQKYIKRRQGSLAKAKARKAFKLLSEEQNEMFTEAKDELKAMKVKYTIDEHTCLPTFMIVKTKKSVSLTMEQVDAFESVEEIIGFVRGSIMVEETDEIANEEKNGDACPATCI